MMTWFEKWFNEHYLDLYADRDNADAIKQINLLIKKLLLDKSKTIIDVGCGLGRHVKIFHDHGYDITGIDLSKHLIEVGKKQFPELNLLHTTVEKLIEDNKKFDLVVSMFTSFGYYEKDEDNFQFLKNMTHLLNSGGNLWLDFLNERYICQQPLIDTITKVSKNDEETDSSVTKYFKEERRINKSSGYRRVEKKITMSQGDEQEVYHESVRIYSQLEIEAMFEKCGLKVVEVFGDYEGHPAEVTTPRSIFWGQLID